MKTQSYLIGIGGTGGKLLREFRKRMYSFNKSFQTEHARISYLYIDSSAKELENHADWQVLGDSIHLNEGEKCRIRDDNALEHVLNNMESTPGIAPWIGDPERVKQENGNSKGAQGANQKRRFGRFLLASHARDVRRSIENGVNQLMKGGNEASVDFHIFCTFAGGTGSGCVVDVISLIRSLYSNQNSYRIFLYGFITAAKLDADTGNFHANQYALLTELNALRLGVWRPHNLMATSKDDPRLENKDNYNVVYLISDINESRRTCDIESQLRTTADYLFQRVVVMGSATPRAITQADSFEDAQPLHEMGQRSYFFASFGLNRLIFPEQDIREKLVTRYAKQVALHLEFNHYTEHGFAESARPYQYRAMVRDTSRLDGWCLRDEHLTLSEDFQPLTANAPWQTIEDEWKAFFYQQRKLIEGRVADKQDAWIKELGSSAQTYFERSFRNEGVQSYYSTMDSRFLVHLTDHIINLIHRDLFNGWSSGMEGYSLADISKLLEELVDELNTTRKDALGRLQTDYAKLQTECLQKADLNKDQHAQVGSLSRLLLKRQQAIYVQYAACLQDYYVARTYNEYALVFAKKLLSAVSRGLGKLRTNVDSQLAKVRRLRGEFQNTLDSLLSGVASGSNGDRHLVDLKLVNATLDKICENGSVQKDNADAIRERLILELGPDPRRTFDNLNDYWTEDALRTLIMRESRPASEKQHDLETRDTYGTDPVIGVNIIERLWQENGQREHLSSATRDLLTNWLKDSSTLVEFNRGEPQPKVLLNNPSYADMPHRARVVFLPRCQARHQNFRDNLRDFLAHYAMTDRIEVLDTEANVHAITAVSVAYWFALRFVQTVHDLQVKFQSRLRSDRQAATQVIFLEDGNITLPSLLLMDDEESRKALIPSLLLCAAANMMEAVEDGGVSQLYVLRRREGGRPVDMYALGCSTWTELLRRVRIDSIREIEALTSQHVVERALVDAEFRRQTADHLDAVLDQVYAECGKSLSDPVYVEYLKHKQAADKRLGGKS